MRVLFTCVPALGHFQPLVPIARALTAAGHEVSFATAAALAPMVVRAGFRHLPAGLAIDGPEVRGFWAEAHGLDAEELRVFTFKRAFAGLLATRMAADVLALPEARVADLLVRDSTELGGCVAAERLGIPHAAVSVLAAGVMPGAREWVAEPLDALRASHGLPPDPEVLMPFRYLTFQQAPRSFLTLPPLPTDRMIRPVPFDQSGDEGAPDWIDLLPRRPIVYATLGTVFNKRPDLLEAFLGGLRDEPVNLILTVGRDQDPDQFGPQPPSVRIERYIPQTLLFPRCDVVLTHGGSGTVMSALSHGLPLVLVPMGADQPDNADRCAALGVGRVLDPANVTSDDVREAVRAVLAGPSYRRNAQRIQREIGTLPGPEHAASLLERLVHEHPRRAPRTSLTSAGAR
jgi:UDP:flavonoid glycosyltransferase YjiC (YdhE family)